MIILTAIGITMILQYGSILKKARDLVEKLPIVGKLLKCSLCLGFWVGVGLSLLEYYWGNRGNEIYYLPFASASASWFFNVAIDYMDIQNISRLAVLKKEHIRDWEKYMKIR